VVKMVKYLLVTKTAHAIPLKPLHILWPVAEVDVSRLNEAFEKIAKAILKLPEDNYILIQAGLPALCSFATLMLYQRFQTAHAKRIAIKEHRFKV